MLPITMLHLLLLLLLLPVVFSSADDPAGTRFPYVQDAALSPNRSEYDYVVIGGGTAGCPLAATLSKRFKVLLLERGGVPYGDPNMDRYELFLQNLAQSNTSSPVQAFVSEDGVLSRRARVLGGGTSVGAGFYSRASKEYIERAGWDAKLVKESYLWVERRVTFVPQPKQWQSAVRKGLLQAGILPDNGVTFDHLAGTKIGGSTFDDEGNRHTSADLLEYAKPNNIDVFVHATVTRILFRPKSNGNESWPKAYGVVYSDKDGVEHTALLKHNARSSVILSAGALGSPQLLLLSGIGPREHLSSLKIPVVLDMAHVGQGMADSPTNAILVPSPRPLEVSLVEVAGITSRDDYVIEAASAQNFTLLREADSPVSFGSRSSIDNGRKNLLRAFSKEAQPFLTRTGLLIGKVDRPLSNGSLKLQSRRVADDPLVRFNYFSRPEDLRRCVRGIQLIEKVIDSRAMRSFKYQNMSQVPKPMQKMVRMLAALQPTGTSDTDRIRKFCKDTVMSFWQYHGGCQPERVVDEKHRVLGVESLRVVDASTFLNSPGTNPQATVMMLGRYMGVQILKEREAELQTFLKELNE